MKNVGSKIEGMTIDQYLQRESNMTESSARSVTEIQSLKLNLESQQSDSVSPRTCKAIVEDLTSSMNLK